MKKQPEQAKERMAQRESRPIAFKLAKWWGFIFAAVFLLYGGVKIVLGFLDRDFEHIVQDVFFAVIGLVLIAVCLAYRELKTWGWYGLIVINGLVIVLSAFNLGRAESIVLIILATGALVALLSRSTKECIARGR